MNKQNILEKIQAKIRLYRNCRNENYNNKDYESSMKFDLLANGLEEGLRYVEQLPDEPSPPEGCGYCLGGEEQIRCIMTYPEGCPSDKGFEFIVNFCPNCGAKIKQEGTK